MLLVVQVGRLFLGAEVLELAVEFAAGLQVVRLATRRGAAHDQQVIVLALLHLIAGTVLGGGLAYGLCFVGFLIVAPGALVLSHLRREVEGNYRQGARDRTGLPVDVPRILRSRRVIGKPFLAFTCLLSVPIFVFTALLFVLFPRVGLSLLLLNHSRPERMIGFSDKVDLGGVGKLRSDPTIAMRVEYPDLPAKPPQRLALYLRGTAFDRYDGRSWSRTAQPAAQGRPARDERPHPPLRQPGPRSPHDDRPRADRSAGVVPAPERGRPQAAAARHAAARRAAEHLQGSRGRVQVREQRRPRDPLRRVPGRAPRSRAPHRSPQTSAALPGRCPPTYRNASRNLARRWVRLARPRRSSRPRPSRRTCVTDYKYDLDSPSGAAKNPLDDFLFNCKRGHCEFYSTAMAVMLRTLGVPTRNVTGFIGGTYNRFGHYYAVRQGDAHSWVEVYLDDKGWTRFDPTPPSDAAPQSEVTGFLAFVRDFVEATAQRWNRHVIGYDLKQQVQLFHNVREALLDASHARRHPGRTEVTATPGDAARRAVLVIGGVVWLRRQQRRGPGPSLTRSAKEVAALQVVRLYRSLEDAMVVHGVIRPSSTPPLSHARALVEMGHPIGPEVLALTRAVHRGSLRRAHDG